MGRIEFFYCLEEYDYISGIKLVDGGIDVYLEEEKEKY